MKPIKNFQKLCDVFSLITLNHEECKFQMYDTTEFWVEPIRRDWENAKINSVVFRPNWENETIRMRIMNPNASSPIPDLLYNIPLSVTNNAGEFGSWIHRLVISHQDLIYR